MRPPDTVRVRLLILIVVELLVMSGRAAGNDSGGSSMTILTLNITGKGYNGGTLTDSHPARVKFTTMTYESFYGCLCNKTTQVCIVPFNNENNLPNFEYDTRETNQTSLMGLHDNSLSPYYTCEVPDLYNASYKGRDNITCNRTNMPEPNCSNSDNFFTIIAEDRCELGGHLVLKWVSYQTVSYRVENRSKINISACTVDGITSTPFLIESSTEGGQTLSDDSSDDNLGIIIGIVVAVVFVIGIIITIFVIRKRKERRRKPCLAKEITGPRTFPPDKTFTQADSSTNREIPTTKEISTQQVTSPKASSENTLNKYTNNPSTNTAGKELHSVTKSDYEIVTPRDADKEVTSDNNSFCVESSDDCSVKFKIISEASDLNRTSVDTDPDDGYSTFGDSKKIRVNPYNVLLKPKENPKERLPASTPHNTPSQLIQRGSGSTKDQADEKTSTNDAENKPDVEKLEVIEVTPASIKTKNKTNKIEARKSAASDDYDYPTCGKISSREDEIYSNPDEEIDDYTYSYTTDDVPEKTKSKVDVDKDSDYSDVDVQSITEIPDDDADSQTYYYSRDTLQANSNKSSKTVSDASDKNSPDILDDDDGSQTYYYSQSNLLPKADEKYGAVLEKWRANLESTFSKTSQGISDSDTIENTGIDETSKRVELVDEDDKVYEEM